MNGRSSWKECIYQHKWTSLFPYVEVFSLPKLKCLLVQNLLFLVITSLTVITSLVLVQFCGFVSHHHKETLSQNKPGLAWFLHYKCTGTTVVHKTSYFSKVLEIPLTSINKLSKCLNAVWTGAWWPCLGQQFTRLVSFLSFFLFLIVAQLLKEFLHFTSVKRSKKLVRSRRTETRYYVFFWHFSFSNSL